MRLLKDAAENYPRVARSHPRRAPAPSSSRATSSMKTRSAASSPTALTRRRARACAFALLYDWLGALGQASGELLAAACAGRRRGAVLQSAAASIAPSAGSRDHRKMIAVDGEVAFVTGLCVGRHVGGRPERGRRRRGATPGSRCAGPRWPTSSTRSPTSGPRLAPLPAHERREPGCRSRPRGERDAAGRRLPPCRTSRGSSASIS